VELSNGHKLVGFLTRRMREALGPPRVGQTLILQVSPYDLSEGRIIGVEQKGNKNESPRISQTTL